GDHEYAVLPVGQRFAGLRVEDLGVEVILPDVAALTLAHSFVGYPRPDDLRQAVDVGGLYPQPGLDVIADRLRPRLRSEDAVAQARLLRADAAFGECFGQRLTVGRGAGDDAGFEVEDERDLALGHAA